MSYCISKFRFPLAVGISLFAASPAWAGPPFVTDDPEPTEYKHSEMYLAVERESSDSGRVLTPMLEYNYGAMPDLQLSITLPYAYNKPAGQAMENGPGDVVLGAKYRFWQETENRPMASIYPVYVLANGNANKGLGNGATQFFLPVWLQKSWGDWTTYGGGGYWFNNAPGVSGRWYAGWEIQKKVSERTTLGAEITHMSEQLPADVSNTGVNFGLTYDVNEHNSLLVSYGRGHGVTDTTVSGTAYAYLAWGLHW